MVVSLCKSCKSQSGTCAEQPSIAYHMPPLQSIMRAEQAGLLLPSRTDACTCAVPSGLWLAFKADPLMCCCAKSHIPPMLLTHLCVVQLQSLARITLRPLTDVLPCMGAVTITLMEQPYLDFSLHVLDSFDLMQFPGVKQLVAMGMEQVREPSASLFTRTWLWRQHG